MKLLVRVMGLPIPARTPVDPKNGRQFDISGQRRSELGIKARRVARLPHTLSTQMLKRFPTKWVSELLDTQGVQNNTLYISAT